MPRMGQPNCSCPHQVAQQLLSWLRPARRQAAVALAEIIPSGQLWRDRALLPPPQLPATSNSNGNSCLRQL